MRGKKNGHGRGYMSEYRTYKYRDGKDPAIFQIKTMIADEGVSEAQAHVISGVSTTTFANWFRGEVRKPQHATLAAIASALGYDWSLVKKKVIDLDKELEAGQRWIDRRKEQRVKG